MPYGTVNADLVTTSSGQSLGAGNATGFKNRIINGGMVFDQRNSGASVTPASGAYMVDRFQYYASQASKFTAQQNAGSVTPPAGFTNYLGMTVASAVSVGASDYFNVRQPIEGLNVADLGWGTADAKTVTLSFWVRSSLTGTFGACFNNSAGNRYYPFSYTISSANTWTQISVTIPGDTTGTWLTTNGVGMNVIFSLGLGSTYLGGGNAWTASSYLAPSGSTSVVGTNGATFYITGVQLEVGSTASSFEVRDYGRELILCQRYYEKSYDISTAPGTATDNGRMINLTGILGSSSSILANSIIFSVKKRTAPTMNSYDASGNSGKITTFDVIATPTQNVSPTYGFGETSVSGTRMATQGAIAGIGCQWTAISEL